MNLFISFSGGETSAFMTKMLLDVYAVDYDQVVVLFANTGQENEQTLEFVNKCDQEFGFNTVWVEAVTHHGMRKANTHRVVGFESASRNGEPFEDSISKYGIPNRIYPICTRDTKTNPMYSYIKSLGWKNGDYHIAVGMRADEPNRRSKDAENKNIIYPLMDWVPSTKIDVNTYWNSMPFRLDLTGYQGNCKTCWKKSLRKLLTVMDETPEAFDWNEKMENKYSTIGHEFKRYKNAEPRRFFRDMLSVSDLRAIHAEGKFISAEDDTIIYHGKQISLDLGTENGCSNSCEPKF